MTDDEYREWVNSHIAATGGNSERVKELLWANRETISDRWRATYAEMCEASDRLVEFGRVPEKASDHTNALKAELDMLRSEKRQHERLLRAPSVAGHTDPNCDCPHCRGGEIVPAFDAALERFRKTVAAGRKRYGSKAIKE